MRHLHRKLLLLTTYVLCFHGQVFAQTTTNLSELVSLGRHYLFLIETPGYVEQGSILPTHFDSIDRSLERLEKYHDDILALVDNIPPLLNEAIKNRQYEDDLADFKALRNRFSEIDVATTSGAQSINTESLIDLFGQINTTVYKLGSHGAYAAPAFIDSATLQHLVSIRLQLITNKANPEMVGIMFDLHRRVLSNWLQSDRPESFDELIKKYEAISLSRVDWIQSFEANMTDIDGMSECVKIAQHIDFDDPNDRSVVNDLVVCDIDLSGESEFAGFVELDQRTVRDVPPIFGSEDRMGSGQSGNYVSVRTLRSDLISRSECLASQPSVKRVRNLGEATVWAEDVAKCLLAEVQQVIEERRQTDDRVRAVKRIARNAQDVLDEIGVAP